MEKQESKVRFPTFPQPRQLRTITQYGIRILRARSYIADQTFYHEVINHVDGYVRAHIHTNGIENFWSLLKRGLNGTYIAVRPFHLDKYVDEQVFRYNNRKGLNDGGRLGVVVEQTFGRRLTYKQLTGKTEGPF